MWPKLTNLIIPWWAYAVVALAVMSAATTGTWWLTAKYKDAIWSAEIANMKKDYADKLLAHTQNVRAIELKLERQNTESEVTNRERKNQIDRLHGDNRALIASGGLRDPGAKSCPATPVPGETVTSVDERETTHGRLSREAEEFLLQFAYDADQAAIYATGCWEREGITSTTLLEY